MNLESAPRLPKLPFFIADAVLLLIAGLLAMLSPRPLDGSTVVIIAILVVLGAALLITPFLLDYAANSADAVTRERERLNEQAARLHAATESLARAAAQIKAVEEAVHKAAREAETLPYRMQEKLAEFNEALAAREDADREALESEVEELRAAHSEKLKASAEKIAKATADLAAVETAARQQLSAAEATLQKLQAAGTAAAATLDQALARTSAQLDAKLAALSDAVANLKVPAAPNAEPHRAPDAPIAANETARTPDPVVEAPPAPQPIEQAQAAASDDVVASPAPEPETAPAASATPATPSEIAAVTTPAEPASELAANASAEPLKPKKPRAPRKPRTEENLLAISDTSDPATSTSAEPEPAPTNGTHVADVAPVSTPQSATPAATAMNGETHANATKPATAAPVSTPAAAPEPDVHVSSSEPEPIDEDAEDHATTNGRAESSSSSDGATRLLATAYIGIGNKLFIRGDGPGLSWDKGVPMQFVSIGKWGWSTQEAAGPIRCKLYKNDETAALTGDITLESGRHTEVTALF